MDVRMAKMSGIEALEKITAYNPSIPVIIMTAYSSVKSAVEALKTGAYDYLMKPLDFEVLKLTLERAHDHTGLKTENRLLKEQLRADLNTTNIIGKSRAMKELLEMLAMAEQSEATVLYLLAGRSVHNALPARLANSIGTHGSQGFTTYILFGIGYGRALT